MGKHRVRGTVRGWRTPRAGERRARGGHTLFELTLAVMFMTFSMGAIVSSLTGSMSLSRANHETSLALDAAQSTLEEIRSTEFSEIFARYNADPGDDPVGTTTSMSFAVAGLDAQRNDPDGLVGRVTFPGDGVTLRENVFNVEMGMPRDLNGDGDSLDDASLDYTIIPVQVTVEWEGAGGNQSLELHTTIASW